MKTIYIIILLVLMLVMASCIICAIKKGGTLVKSITRLLICGILSSVFYCLYLITDNIMVATFMDGMYFLMCDVLSYFMMRFTEGYTESKSQNAKWHKIIIGIMIFDSICLLLNNIMEWTFYLTSRPEDSVVFFEEVFKIPFYIHVSFCYVMIAYSFWLMIYHLKISDKIYRIKYIIILAPYILVIVVNAICYNKNLPIDISVCLYGVVSVGIYLCIYRLVPSAIINKVQAYISENSYNGIFCFDQTGKCIYVNKKVKECEAWKNKNNRIEIQEYFNSQKEYIKGIGKDVFTWSEQVDSNGEKRHINFTYQNISNYSTYCIIATDETEKIKTYEEEKYRANYDSLTGLYNANYFSKIANKIIMEESDRKKWLIVSDIKDFKLINNIYGNEFGDEILKLQAKITKEYLSDDVIGGRISGDKFALLVVKENYEKEKLNQAIERIERFVKQKEYKLCYHVGIYDITGISEPVELLYNKVNLAIDTITNDYEQKFIECNNSIMNKVMEERKMIAEFDTAINNGEFKMYLQPQIDSTSKKVIGAEALVRWIHPQKGIIFPGQFISVFEKSGLIHKLDIEIWKQAAQKLAEWAKNGEDDMYISINISAKDFYYLNIYDELTSIVEGYKIKPEKLKLEITESAILIDQDNNFKVLSALREYGFELEIDDFGSGYSSFNLLKDICFDVLKIDRIFLKETENADKAEKILKAMIDLAKSMGMKVVAEGVENIYQIGNLTKMQCDIFQGFYFDKPISVESFEGKYLKK